MAKINSKIDNFLKLSQKEFSSWRYLLTLTLLIILNLATLDVFAHKIFNRWQLFADYYEGYRHPASVIQYLPFSTEVIKNDKEKVKIIFTGDSTSGALLYHHSQAIPAYLNDYLNANKFTSHTYNMAFSGAHLSEQYFLMKELVDYSDIIIFPIHYTFFSGRGDNNTFISRPEIANFLTKVEKEDLEPLDIKPKNQLEQIAEKNIGNVWFLYKTHKLLPYIVYGKSPKSLIKDKIYGFLEKNPKESDIQIDYNKPFYHQTEETQDLILNQNKILWQKIENINEDNINLIYLDKIGALNQKSGKRFIAYFVPLDYQLLTQKGIIQEQTYGQIVKESKKTLDKYEIEYIDFTNIEKFGLEKSDFYNPDHLLPQGNKKVAKILSQIILEKQNDILAN